MPSFGLSHGAIDGVLATAAGLLGMEVVFVGGLTADTYTFERVRTTEGAPGPVEGSVTQRADTFCHKMLAGSPASTSDAAQDPAYADTPAREQYGVTSYVGVPIRTPDGQVVATLCGIDRRHVVVDDRTIAILRQLATVVGAYLCPVADEGVVIRRSTSGGWAVAGQDTGDLTSAMVLADLLATELDPGARPAKVDAPLDELSRLRLSVVQLEHALAARVVVEQAIGVLSERQHTSPREAFERLRKVARSRGRKVHDLAKEVVTSSRDHSVPLPPELAGQR